MRGALSLVVDSLDLPYLLDVLTYFILRYEAITHYGNAIKMLINEQVGS